MPKNRIIPALALVVSVSVWAWSQEPKPAPAPVTPAEAPTDAEILLDDAAKKVAAIPAISADLVEKVTMLGQNFEVKGRYLRAPGSRVYLLLEVAGLPDSTGKMLQVSDGVTLWDVQQVFETRIFRKFTIAKIFDKLKSPDLDAPLRDQITTQLGLSGPEILLTGLRKAIRFDQKPQEATLDGKPVWVLRGAWKDRTGLLGPNQQPLPALAPLPAYVPSLAIVTIGRDDGWPYKVELVGNKPSVLMEDTRPIGPDGRRIGSHALIQKPMVTRIVLTYSNLKLNPTLGAQDFAFQAPPDAHVEDLTETVVNSLEQAAQMKAAQKKAEASAAPLLDQSIEVPKDDAPPAAPLLPSRPESPR